MNPRTRSAALVIVLIILLISGIYYFLSSSTLNFFSKDTSNIPLITATEAEEYIPAVWVWLGSTEVINESGNYYLAGNIGDKQNLHVKVFLGSENTYVGYASSKDWGTKDEKFPERFPEWTEQMVSKIEVDSASSDYALVKIFIEPIPAPAPEDCDEDCNILINKQVELLENNLKIKTITEKDKIKDMEIGPAIQVLQILDV